MKIYVTGRVSIETPTDIVEASALPGRQGRLAFVLLATEPRRLDRNQIASILWAEGIPDTWETSLAAIMSKIRRLLSDLGLPGSNMLQASDGSYELRLPPGTWVDARVATNAVVHAEGLIRRGQPHEAWAEATVASTICRRSFLAGEHGAWIEQRRREMHENEIRAYDVICQVWLELGDPVAAFQAARRLVDLAPYRESAHARMMEAHLAAGNRAEALAVYEQLRELLADTMGISPGPATEQLYERAIR